MRTFDKNGSTIEVGMTLLAPIAGEIKDCLVLAIGEEEWVGGGIKCTPMTLVKLDDEKQVCYKTAEKSIISDSSIQDVSAYKIKKKGVRIGCFYTTLQGSTKKKYFYFETTKTKSGYAPNGIETNRLMMEGLYALKASSQAPCHPLSHKEYNQTTISKSKFTKKVKLNQWVD